MAVAFPDGQEPPDPGGTRRVAFENTGSETPQGAVEDDGDEEGRPGRSDLDPAKTVEVTTGTAAVGDTESRVYT